MGLWILICSLENEGQPIGWVLKGQSNMRAYCDGLILCLLEHRAKQMPGSVKSGLTLDRLEHYVYESWPGGQVHRHGLVSDTIGAVMVLG
jgi:hypothetical protein